MLAKLLPFALLAACADQPDTVEPLISDSHRMLTFDLSGDASFTYDVDTGSYSLAGERIELATADGRSCRTRLADSQTLALVDAAKLAEALGATTIVTLGEDACSAAMEGCGGDPQGYLSVTIDDRFFTQAPGCTQLVSSVDLRAVLDVAFDSLRPTRELVEWDVNALAWKSTGLPCPSDDSL